MPEYFKTFCTSTLPLVDNCYFTKGWFIANGVITTGENSPGDLQLTLGGKFDIKSEYGGTLKYRLRGYNMYFDNGHTFMTILDGAVNYSTAELTFQDGNQFVVNLDHHLTEGEHSIYFIFDKGVILNGQPNPHV